MKKTILIIAALVIGAVPLLSTSALAADATTIDRDVARGLQKLFASTPGTKALARRAQAVLVFPKVVKGGFVFGGKYGEGALLENGHTIGYYSTAGASYGFQAGVTEFGYAMFFMDDASLAYFKKSKGWEVGVGPTVVVADASFVRDISSTTVQKGVYAFFFNQKGLMAGAGLQGSKITRIFPD
jgi:lipid-binding SYLF domain-containing protein